MEIILLSVLAVLIIIMLILLYILLRKISNNEESRNQQSIDGLEHTLYEALRDLRGEQNVLARAARMENQASSDRLSEQIDKRVARLADMTDKSLERIRSTVDENLNDSLDKKFMLISKRLEEMHRGLGEMQGLAGGVDDLKRILSNVKTRGIWGEMQLGVLLKDMLPQGRFAENVEVKPRSGLRVEFALKLPGSEHEVYLPIDAKFPQEDYQRLQSAKETGNKTDADAALKLLERRLKNEAKDIKEKYIYPPYSTDFAVMYLPSEGLFAEAVNIPGLMDDLQRNYRVSIAGPTTLAALLNSLQMGFRTFAVQQKNAEAWRILAEVKQDMEILNVNLEKIYKKIEETENNITAAKKRVNIISKKIEAIEDFDAENREQ